MADKKITDVTIPLATNIADNDVFHTVDVSDPTDGVDGTSKRGLFSLIKTTIKDWILGLNNTFTGNNIFNNPVTVTDGVAETVIGNGEVVLDGGNLNEKHIIFEGGIQKFKSFSENTTLDIESGTSVGTWILRGDINDSVAGLNEVTSLISSADTSEWAESIGTRAGGDLVVSIGDYDSSNDNTGIEIDDSTGEIRWRGLLKNMDGTGLSLINNTGNRGSIFLHDNTLTADRNYDLPDASGKIALESAATGSFTSNDGKTITVSNGIITSIV